jgi:hypothetical protein
MYYNAIVTLLHKHTYENAEAKRGIFLYIL